MDAFGAAAAALQFGVSLFKATQVLDAVLNGNGAQPIVTAKKLAEITKGECDAFLQKHPSSSTPAMENARIIAQQGKDVCTKLLKTIAKMHPDRKSPRTVLRALVAIMWSKDELAELQKSLSACMEALERFLSKQDRAAVDAALKQTEKVLARQMDALSQQDRAVVNAALKQAEKALASQIDAKSDQIIALHTETSAQADNRWAQATQLANAETVRRSTQKKVKLLLDALAFPGMGQRLGSVSPADEKTFSWILKREADVDASSDQWLSDGDDEDSDDDDWSVQSPADGDDQGSGVDASSDQWLSDGDDEDSDDDDWSVQSPADGDDQGSGVDDRFVQWLTSGNGIFHIAGKPGSGKSTLMKYVFENSATKQMLEQWAAGKTLVQAACFFWKPGNVLQRTMVGLMRTLLHGMIISSHDVAKILFPEVWDAADTDERAEISLSDRVVQQAFQHLVDGDARIADAGIRCCFFIDGLDEYGDASNKIVQLVRQLTRMAQNGSGWLKICASSREYPEITEKLTTDEAHRLTLQDLTRGDIAVLVNKRLQEAFPDTDMRKNRDLMELEETIIQRAEGVFLWVVLVLGIIDDEAELGTPVCELLSFVEVQHDDLNAFFETVVARIEKRDRRTAAVFFQYALQTDAIIEHGVHGERRRFAKSLLLYTFLLEHPVDGDSGDEDAVLARYETIQQRLQTNEGAKARLCLTTKRIQRSCEGLLTVERTPEPVAAWAAVGLTHRSIHEFLTTLLATKWKDAVADFDAAGAFVRMLCVLKEPADPYINPKNAEFVMKDFFAIAVSQGPHRIGADKLHQNFQLMEAFAERCEGLGLFQGYTMPVLVTVATIHYCYEYLDWRRRTPHEQVGRWVWTELLSLRLNPHGTADLGRWSSTTMQLLESGAYVSAVGIESETPWWAMASFLSHYSTVSIRGIRPGLSKSLEAFIQASDDIEDALPMWVRLGKNLVFVEVNGHPLESSLEASAVCRTVWELPNFLSLPMPADKTMPCTMSLAEMMATLGLSDRLVARAEAREPAAACARRSERLLRAESVAELISARPGEGTGRVYPRFLYS